MGYYLTRRIHTCGCGETLYNYTVVIDSPLGPPLLRCNSCNNVTKSPFKLWNDLDVQEQNKFHKQFKKISQFLGIISAIIGTIFFLFLVSFIFNSTALALNKSTKDIYLLVSFIFFFLVIIGTVRYRKNKLDVRIKALEDDFNAQKYRSRDFFNW